MCVSDDYMCNYCIVSFVMKGTLMYSKFLGKLFLNYVFNFYK